jgi:hypothetical protein
MIRFAADEDFNNDVVRALRRSLPDVNIVEVREAGRGRPDPDVLAWAAEEGRIVLTHDVTTMTRHALERVARGEAMPGVIAVQSAFANSAFQFLVARARNSTFLPSNSKALRRCGCRSRRRS